MNKNHGNRNKHIYYNVSIPHNEIESINGEPTKAIYFEVRSEALLKEPASNYSLSVIRMSIPMDRVPLSIFPIDILQPNINQSIYTISIKWAGFLHKVPVIWNTSNSYAIVPPTITDVKKLIYSEYYSLYSVKHLLDLINASFVTAFNLLVVDGFPLSAPPFFRYDTTTKLINLYVPETYKGEGVNIYCNNLLNNNWYGSFDQKLSGYSTNGENAEFIYNNVIETVSLINGTYPTELYLVSTQEYNTLKNMSSVNSLILTTRALPIKSEWISLQQPKNGISQELTLSSLNIISDFEFDISNSNNIRSNVIYNPTAEYRRANLLSNDLINTIDISVFWKDNSDNLYPLMISANNVLTIKILFEHI